MPGANLTIAGVAAVNRVEDVLAEFGLVLKTFSVLVVITGEPEPLTPTVIAERTVIAKTTITSALDALERLDLVRREPHPTSHRSVLVRATQHGEAVAGGGARAAARIRGTLVQGQVGGDRQRLIELLGQGRSIDEMSVVRIPERLSFEEAATPPCAAVLAWSALTTADRPLVAGSARMSASLLTWKRAVTRRWRGFRAHGSTLLRPLFVTRSKPGGLIQTRQQPPVDRTLHHRRPSTPSRCRFSPWPSGKRLGAS